MTNCKLPLTIPPNRLAVAAILAALFCFVVYVKTLSAQFVSLDDFEYIVNNEAIRHLDSTLLQWSFSPPAIDLWIPFTWISFALDYHFWQLNPFGYHLTNILLHALNTVLVVLLAAQLMERAGTNWHLTTLQSTVALVLSGVLFGIHPLRVESVAWVTERKDVLSGAFSLGTMIFYLKYTALREARTQGVPSHLSYGVSLFLFVGALLSKPITVVLPLLFLVVDIFPLHRWKKGCLAEIFIEKIPFFLLSAAIAFLTIYFSKSGTVPLLASMESILPAHRFLVSGNALFQYCRMTLLPVGILPSHIIPDPLPGSYILGSICVVSGLLLCACMVKRKPALFALMLAFVVPLLPVSGFFQNGIQAFASRYTYLPSVPVSIAAAILIVLFWRKLSAHFSEKTARLLTGSIVMTLVFFYATLTLRLISVWHDSGTLWTRVISFQPYGMAYFARGMYFDREVGHLPAALADYSMAIALCLREGQPGIDNVYAYRGEVYRKLGRYEESVGDYSTAIRYNPFPEYFIGRSVTFKLMGEAEKAQRDDVQARILINRANLVPTFYTLGR